MTTLSSDQKIDLLHSDLRSSCFNKSFYNADLPFGNFVSSILRYFNRDLAKALENEEASLADGIDAIMSSVPVFQRDADKWTPAMQQQYILNVLRGYRGGYLSLYSATGTGSFTQPCLILDGLQRITAICRFMKDRDMIFPLSNGDVVSASELLDSDRALGHMLNVVVPIRIYRFNNEREAVTFYIEMNEGITHSADDIKRAKDYLLTLK